MSSTGVRKELFWISAALALAGITAGQKRLAAGLGGMALALRFWPSRGFRYDGASVVVTGGSRGLGLALAENLLKRGARVTLLARDPEELDRARARLERGRETRVYTVTCDVTKGADIDRAIRLAVA